MLSSKVFGNHDMIYIYEHDMLYMDAILVLLSYERSYTSRDDIVERTILF